MFHSDNYNKWLESKNEEVAFWDRFFATRGSAYGSDYAVRMNPNQPLDIYHRKIIDSFPTNHVKILDVGSGPLTIFGKTHPSKILEITACDALADEYNRIMEKYNVVPPLRSQFCYAEHLSEKFPEDTYQLVYARNSLDHTFDPFESILQMIRVAQRGCWVVLNHFVNVGEAAGYHGLHQWGFIIQENQLFLKGFGIQINITREISPLVIFEYLEQQGAWIVVHMNKRKNVTPQGINSISDRNQIWSSVHRMPDVDGFLKHQPGRVLTRYLWRRIKKRLLRGKSSAVEDVPVGLPRPPI